MIHERVSPEKLAVIRAVTFASLALYALSVPGEQLALLPLGFHRPLGLAALLPAVFLSHGVLLGLRLTTAALLLAAAAGARPFHWLAGLGMLLFTLYLALLHPGHRELGALYLGYALAVGPSDAAWSVGKARTGAKAPAPEAFALTLEVATFVFLLTYSLIGTQRLMDSAPTVFRDGSMLWHVASTSGRNGSFGFTLGYALLEHFPVARTLIASGFLVATYLEALAPLALFFTPFRRVFLIFALGFHAMNLALLNIEFVLNMLVDVLLLVDWDPRPARKLPERNVDATGPATS